MSDDSKNNDIKMESTQNTEGVIFNNVAKVKKRKRGIVYLSSIPKYMNITKIRELFSAYELERNGGKKKQKKVYTKFFTEGWVEFESKKIAKYVAFTLNNTQISTRKKSKFYDVIWNIKYLPRFKWIHLSERLAYERAVHKQRLQTEIAQAKREANFYSHNVDRSRKLHQVRQDENSTFVPPMIKQRDTDAEIRSKKESKSVTDRTDFLKSLFG
ncbi:activator of basal transcription 1-like isoform X2 [Frieseomelitta varia]|uniref:activator of basal transcription 1-like isoform X2 n=1 Tax=Frieseomelitta varia TaxID=561572 RepID=UPI001CB69F59|nr:activator of basal transcription 1-like isoform X2 [Frieseomelitta varia]